MQAGDTLEDGVKLGDVTSQLSKIGVQVLDGDGKMRGVGDIMEDLMGVWQSIDSTQKAAVAQTLAGKYQLSRFEALMNSPDMYNQYLQASEKESQAGSTYGTMDVMNEKYLDSLQGKMSQLQATVEGIINDTVQSDAFYPWLDTAQNLLNVIQQISGSVGGMQNVVMAIVNSILKATRTNMSAAITPALMNAGKGIKAIPRRIRGELSGNRQNDRQAGAEELMRDALGDEDYNRLQQARSNKAYQKDNVGNEDVAGRGAGLKTAKYAQDILQYSDVLSNDQKEKATTLIDAMGKAESKRAESIEKLFGKGGEDFYDKDYVDNIRKLMSQDQGAFYRDEGVRKLYAKTKDDKTNTGSIKRYFDTLNQLNGKDGLVNQARQATQDYEQIAGQLADDRAALRGLRDTSGKKATRAANILARGAQIENGESKPTDYYVYDKNNKRIASKNVVGNRTRSNKSDSDILENPTAGQKEYAASIDKAVDNLVNGRIQSAIANLEKTYKTGEAPNKRTLSVTGDKFQENIGKIFGIANKNAFSGKEGSDPVLSQIKDAYDTIKKDLSEGISTKNTDELLEKFKQLASALLEVQKAAKLAQQGLSGVDESAIDEVSSTDESKLADRIARGEVVEQRKNDADKALSDKRAEATKDQKTLLEQLGQYFTSGQQMDRVEAQLGDETETAKVQKRVDSVMELSQAVADYGNSASQLASLGSLWNKDDISDGEKLGQTFENLIFTAPQLIQAFGGMSDSLSTLGSFFNMSSEAAAAFGVAGGAIGVILTALIAVIQGVNQANQQAQQNAQNAISDAQSYADSLSNQTKSWEELYQQYQKTGTVTDEFRQSSIELAKATGDAGAQAEAAAGNYDALAKSIGNANDEAQKKVIQEVNNDIEAGGANYNSRHPDWLLGLTNGSMDYDLQIGQQKAVGDLYNSGTDFSFSNYAHIKDISSDAEKIGTYRNEIEGLQQELDSYGSSAQAVGMDEDEWTKKTSALRSAIGELNSALQTEDIKNYDEDITKAAEATGQLSDFQKKISEAGTNTDAIQNVFTSNDAFERYFQAQNMGMDTFSDKAQRIGVMLQYITDETQKQAMVQEEYIAKAQDYGQQHGFNTDEIKQDLENSGLSNEQLIDFVGTLDDSTYTNFADAINSYKQQLKDNGLLTLDANLNIDGLSNINDTVDSQQSLWESYNKTENGFTDQQVASIVEENPDYIRYLTQVGDVWKMNEVGLQAYNNALDEQSDKLDEIRGKTMDMSGYNDTMNAMQSDDEFDMGKYSDEMSQLEGLNNQMSSGQLSGTDFFDGVSSQIDNFTEKISGAVDGTKEFTQAFGDAGQGASNFAAVLSSELAEGLDNLKTQYNAGEINLADYAGAMNKGIKSSKKLMSQSYGLSKGIQNVADDADISTETFDKWIDSQEDLTDRQKQGAKELRNYNDTMGDSEKTLDAVQRFSSDMVDQYDDLTKVFQDNGEVQKEVMTSNEGIQEQYRGTIQNLAGSVVEYAMNSSDAMDTLVSEIASTTNQSEEAVRSHLNSEQSASEMTNYVTQQMMGSAATATGVLTGIGSQAQAAVAMVASGVSQIISGISESISGLSGEVDVTPEPTGAYAQGEITADTTDGKHFNVGTIHLQGLKATLSGNSSGGGSINGSSAAAYQKPSGSGWVATGKLGKWDNKNRASNDNWYVGSGIGQQFVKYDNNGNVVDEAWRGASNAQVNLYSGVASMAGGFSLGKMFGSGGGGGNTINPTGTGGKKGRGGGGGSGRKPSSGRGGGGSGRKPSSGGGGGGSGRKPSSGGGGGGGGGSSYTPKEKEHEEDEVDRYERIDTILNNIENTVDQLKTDQDRLTGKELLDNLNKTLPILEKQIKYENEKLNIQRAESQELKEQLANDYGIGFDSEGFITNYAEVHDKLLGDVNNLIDQYNAATTEEAQDALDKQIDAAKDKLDDFNDTYKRYDELWGKDIQDTQKEIQDLIDDIEDMNIDAFNKSVDAIDNIKDIMDTWHDFEHNMHRGIDENPFDEMADSAERLNDYFDLDTADNYFDNIINKYKEIRDTAQTDEQRNHAQNMMDIYSNAKAQQGKGTQETGGTGLLDMPFEPMDIMLEQLRQYNATGDSTIFGENGSELYESAQDVYEMATDMVDDFWDKFDDLHDKIMDCIDDINDRMDAQNKKFENINDQLDHMSSMAEYIYGDEAWDKQNQIIDAQTHNNEAYINNLQQQIDVWNGLLDDLRKNGRDVVDGRETEEYKEIKDNIKDLSDEINDRVEDSADKFKTAYENSINDIIDKWTAAPFNGQHGGLDWMATEWELINYNADLYLDKTNRAYNIQKLQNKYLDLLDDNNGKGLATQQKITEQMNKELDYLKNKTNLSEYDVKVAEARLDILQKQIALEDAQQNKNQMKLRRDTQGNYRYVYTADQDQVRQAQDDLLDSSNNAYNLDIDRNQEVQGNAIQALQNYADKYNDIMNDLSLTDEQRQERLATLQGLMNQYLEAMGEQLSAAQKNTLQDFITMCDNLTDENKEDLNDVYNQIKDGNADAFQQIDNRWRTSIVSWLNNINDFELKTDKAMNDMMDTNTQYQDNLDNLSEVAKKNYGDITGNINDAKKATDDLANSTNNFISQLKADAGTIQDYNKQIAEYAEKASDANNKAGAYYDDVQKLKKDLENKNRETASLSSLLNAKNGVYVPDSLYVFQDAKGDKVMGTGTEAKKRNYDSGFNVVNSINKGTKTVYRVYDPYEINGILHWYTDSKSKYDAKIAEVRDRLEKSNYRDKNGGIIRFPDGSLMDASRVPEGSFSIDDAGWQYLQQQGMTFFSGGYTGSWDDKTPDDRNGKWAILHQKELILNAADTENILQAVNMVREMTNSLKNGIIQNAMDSVSAAYGNAKSVQAPQDVNQNVQITAEFPNATSAQEIEDAILGLNGRSIQYAFETRK